MYNMETFLIIFIILVIFCSLIKSSGNKQKVTQSETPETTDVYKVSQNVPDLKDLTKYVWIDTETSSLEVDRGEVLQLSAIRVDEVENGEYKVRMFNKYVKPSGCILPLCGQWHH